jgi:hypothetical protein
MKRSYHDIYRNVKNSMDSQERKKMPIIHFNRNRHENFSTKLPISILGLCVCLQFVAAIAQTDIPDPSVITAQPVTSATNDTTPSSNKADSTILPPTKPDSLAAKSAENIQAVPLPNALPKDSGSIRNETGIKNKKIKKHAFAIGAGVSYIPVHQAFEYNDYVTVNSLRLKTITIDVVWQKTHFQNGFRLVGAFPFMGGSNSSTKYSYGGSPKPAPTTDGLTSNKNPSGYETFSFDFGAFYEAGYKIFGTNHFFNIEPGILGGGEYNEIHLRPVPGLENFLPSAFFEKLDFGGGTLKLLLGNAWLKCVIEYDLLFGLYLSHAIGNDDLEMTHKGVLSLQFDL